ncbi:MAG: hypothetical protein ACRYFZ_04120 [Janthinobacterium lividum]
MKLRLLATPLVATTLLLSTLGCAKKEDATPTPTASGSYILDGKTINCTVKAVVQTSLAGNPAQSYDVLDVELTTTPQPASGPEKLDLYFQKQTGQSPNAYQRTAIILVNPTHPQGLSYSNGATTLSEASGLYYGGFGGVATGPPSSEIKAGGFNDVRPQ